MDPSGRNQRTRQRITYLTSRAINALSVQSSRPPDGKPHRAPCSHTHSLTYTLTHINTHSHTHSLILRTKQRPGQEWNGDECKERSSRVEVDQVAELPVMIVKQRSYPVRPAGHDVIHGHQNGISQACGSMRRPTGR